jgi:heme A synthase
LVSFAAMLGGLAFFVFCQLRFGNWNIYMLTQQFGWGIEPDYLAVFRPSNYRWLTPALENPTQTSQMAMTIGAIMLVALVLLEFGAAFRRRVTPSDRIAFYFAAAVLFFISVAGVACVGMESMLRYEFCVHALIVLALLHYLHNVPLRSRLGRASAVTAIALISGAGLSLESWYVWNFTRGNWVA